MVRLKLDQVGLSGYEDYFPSQLSGGMKSAPQSPALSLWTRRFFFSMNRPPVLDPIIAAGIDELILE